MNTPEITSDVLVASKTPKLLCNMITPVAASYSIRRLCRNYNGPLIRVRRSSDNNELDIRYTDCNVLDVASLLSFVGSNTGYVTTWYDQSGNGKHAIQATASKQPQICASGSVYVVGGKPSLLFVPANQTYLVSSVFNFGPNAIVTGVVTPNASTSGANSKWISGSGSEWTSFKLGAETTKDRWRMCGVAIDSASITYAQNVTQVRTCMTFSTSTPNLIGYTNGTSVITTTGTPIQLTSGVVIGASWVDGQYWIGYISEIFIVSNSSDTVRKTIEHNQGIAYGVAVA